MKKFFLLFIVLLAATSCTTDKDEPVYEPLEETTLLYMATEGFPGYPEMIIDLHGVTIWQCEDAESSIRSLFAEGADWYAVILKGDGEYNVVKNGKSIYSTVETIHCFTVEDGSIYTVQEDKSNNTTWVCKDFERLYEVVGDVFCHTFSVDHGNVILAVRGETPCYWSNGEFIPIEGLEGGIDYVYGIDKKGDDMLITYRDMISGKGLYWWNGVTHEYNFQFAPTSSCIAKGHTFIFGKMTFIQGAANKYGLPTLLMDGYENILSTDAIDCSAIELVENDGNIYVLVKSVRGVTSYIFVGFYLFTLPEIEIPDRLKPSYSYCPNGRINLSKLGINHIAVLDCNP